MKKILTIVAIIATLVVGIFLLTGCGKSEDKKDEKSSNTSNNENSSNTSSNGEYQGAISGAGDKLKNVSDQNYKNVAKSVFGIEISDNAGWTLKTAKSPNGVNNLNITYIIDNGEDAKKIIEDYFNKSLSNGTVSTYGFNADYTAMVKGDAYTSFSAFAEKNLTSIYGLYQAMWIYEYNGKTVLFSISCNESSAEISFGLLS